MKRAACKGLSHLFFPAAAERPQARERREAAARSVCGSCDVDAQCRQFARMHHEYGFWGGESEDERHAAGFRLIAPIGIRARAS
jgi:WhiB family redox-sensing transcriptional regulator